MAHECPRHSVWAKIGPPWQNLSEGWTRFPAAAVRRGYRDKLGDKQGELARRVAGRANVDVDVAK